MVEGLGFRYYWATEDLREQDMEYRPSEDGRSTQETMEHLYGLSLMIRQACRGEANVSSPAESSWTIEELRDKTLSNLRSAIDALSDEELSMEEREIIWQRGEDRSTLSFWYAINGPIADAIYHTGQVVSFRRSSGNPMPSGVSVLSGTKRN